MMLLSVFFLILWLHIFLPQRQGSSEYHPLPHDLLLYYYSPRHNNLGGFTSQLNTDDSLICSLTHTSLSGVSRQPSTLTASRHWQFTAIFLYLMPLTFPFGLVFGTNSPTGTQVEPGSHSQSLITSLLSRQSATFVLTRVSLISHTDYFSSFQTGPETIVLCPSNASSLLLLRLVSCQNLPTDPSPMWEKAELP